MNWSIQPIQSGAVFADMHHSRVTYQRRSGDAPLAYNAFEWQHTGMDGLSPMVGVQESMNTHSSHMVCYGVFSLTLLERMHLVERLKWSKR
jgi:hypothetical protein